MSIVLFCLNQFELNIRMFIKSKQGILDSVNNIIKPYISYWSEFLDEDIHEVLFNEDIKFDDILKYKYIVVHDGTFLKETDSKLIEVLFNNSNIQNRMKLFESTETNFKTAQAEGSYTCIELSQFSKDEAVAKMLELGFAETRHMDLLEKCDYQLDMFLQNCFALNGC